MNTKTKRCKKKKETNSSGKNNAYTDRFPKWASPVPVQRAGRGLKSFERDRQTERQRERRSKEFAYNLCRQWKKRIIMTLLRLVSKEEKSRCLHNVKIRKTTSWIEKKNHMLIGDLTNIEVLYTCLIYLLTVSRSAYLQMSSNIYKYIYVYVCVCVFQLKWRDLSIYVSIYIYIWISFYLCVCRYWLIIDHREI